MKLSENTVNILKNYATINPSLLVNTGNVLSTMSPTKAMYAYATVEENFPRQFAIYELSKFLGVMSLFKEPELNFDEQAVTIVSGRQTVKYTYTNPNNIVAPDPNKKIAFPTADIEFSISQEELQRVVRAAGVLQLKEAAVFGNAQNITMTATDSKNPTADVFSVEVGETDKTFAMYFDIHDIIKLLPNDYNVKITSKGLSQFSSNNIVYYVGIKANSTFNG